MITAALQLAEFGISLAAAHTWVFAHLQEPALIFEVARQYGITNGMLGEIAGSGISAEQVVDFFASQGIDSSSLDVNEARVDLIPKQIPEIQGILAMNSAAGLLSTQALRADVQSLTGELAYWELFSPNRLAGAFDGVLSPQELGSNVLGPVQATAQGIESLFYGTMIKLFASIDAVELAAIQDFAAKSFDEIKAGDKAAIAGYELLIAKAMQDPAAHPLSEGMLKDVLVDVTKTAVALVGTDNAPFELLLPLLN